MNTAKQTKAEKPKRVALTGISTPKANRQSIKRRAINVSNVSRMKTFGKKAIVEIADLARINASHTTDLKAKTLVAESAVAAFKIAQSIIASSVKKSIIKPNTASRKISRLAHRLKAAEAILPSATTTKEGATKVAKKSKSK